MSESVDNSLYPGGDPTKLCNHAKFLSDCESVQKLVCRFCKKTEREIVLEMKLKMANSCADEAESQLSAANARIAELEEKLATAKLRIIELKARYDTCYARNKRYAYALTEAYNIGHFAGYHSNLPEVQAEQEAKLKALQEVGK